MKRYILTGTPGAGKTTLLRALSHKELSVVEEAATDIIQQEQALGVSEPWLELNFIPKVLEVQKYRQSLTNTPSNSVQFYDRSPICTYALCLFLQRPIPTSLQNEVDRIISKKFMKLMSFLSRT